MVVKCTKIVYNICTVIVILSCRCNITLKEQLFPAFLSAGVHGGGDDASPAAGERSRLQEPLPERQEEERPVAGVGSPRPPGQLASLHPLSHKDFTHLTSELSCFSAASNNPLCSSAGEPQRPRQEARRRQRQPALRRRGGHVGETQGKNWLNHLVHRNI